MAIIDLLTILGQDTLAEGRDKMNSAINRLNAGEFNNAKIYGDLEVDGELRVTRLVQIESESQEIGDPLLRLSEVTLGSDDGAARGIIYKYYGSGTEKFGFFGRLQTTADGQNRFTFIPDATISGDTISHPARPATVDLTGRLPFTSTMKLILTRQTEQTR